LTVVKVPNNFQDYDDDDPNIDKRKARMKYWENLRKLKLEFTSETGNNDHREYMKWLENTYGLRPIETQNGMLSDDYTVVDEKKFLVYILKYE